MINRRGVARPWIVVAVFIVIVFGLAAYAAPETAAHVDKEPGLVKISAERAAQAGVTVVTAGPGRIGASIELPGEVRLNADRVAHVTPRVPGVVAQVVKNLGDSVRAGEVMAAIESKELAVAKAAYLAARERVSLAQATYDREKGLWEKKISAEQDYLAAKQALAEAGIESRSAEQQLRALGLSKDGLRQLSGQSEDLFTRYEITAPIDGTVIEKRIVLGESLQAESMLYVVADLGTVWVDFSVPPQYLPSIHLGQEVVIRSTGESPAVPGKIAYVGPTVEQDTRAALARVILPNEQGIWKPGMFVTGLAEDDAAEAPVAVPKLALQTLGGAPNVFVKTDEGFQASPVTLGRTGMTNVEVIAGLQAGQSYASAGTFILKAELEKGKGDEE
jgi:cobalt-zinc-cadmium efflux system membrane fusion protein